MHADKIHIWFLTRDGLPTENEDGYKGKERSFRQQIKRHNTFNYSPNPVGPLGYGLIGTCIKQVVMEDKNLHIPTIMIANMTSARESH